MRTRLSEPRGRAFGRHLGLVFALTLALTVGTGSVGAVPVRSAGSGAEVGIVVGLAGSDRLAVALESGETIQVQYIGLHGPVRSSLLHAAAAAFHGQLVKGHRVRLEADGRDQEGGYRLRHAYLDDQDRPVGAAILAAGWAKAVPYPPDHRHAALYRQLERAAVSKQANLWRPGLLGPAAAWQPPGGDDSRYLAAAPELQETLDLLYTVPTGRATLDTLAGLGPALQVRELGEGLGAYSERFGYQILLNRSLLWAIDPRATASALAHKASHAIDYAAAAARPDDFSCFDLEERAFTLHAQVWAEFQGPNGKASPQDSWDLGANEILRFAARGDLANFVTRSSAYEYQCAGERAP